MLAQFCTHKPFSWLQYFRIRKELCLKKRNVKLWNLPWGPIQTPQRLFSPWLDDVKKRGFNYTVSYIGTHWNFPRTWSHNYVTKLNHACTLNDLVILITYFFLSIRIIFWSFRMHLSFDWFIPKKSRVFRQSLKCIYTHDGRNSAISLLL